MSEPQNPSDPPSGGWPQQPGQQPGQQPRPQEPPPQGQPYPPPPDPAYQPPDYQQPAYQQPAYPPPDYQQPDYQQQGYQQPAYQQPYQQWQQQYAYPSGQRLGVVGLVLAFVGEALLMISLLGLDWTERADGITASFRDLTDAAKVPGAPGLTHAYFVWLGWVFVIATVLIAILANLPIGKAAGFFRLLGPLVALGGIAVTIFALKGDNSLGDVFDAVDIGFWVACGGFVVAGIGAAIGPRSS